MGFPFQLRPVIFLTIIFYVNFLSRNVIAPLLPVIEAQYGLGYGRAGTLFLFSAAGMCTGYLLSGFLSAGFNHRLTVLFSAAGMGAAMLAMTQTTTVGMLSLWLYLLGVAAGLYMPSGIAILTEVAASEHWGKVMAVHELAPNLGLVTAPLLVEIILTVGPWQSVMALLGVFQFFMAGLFLCFGQGGAQKGTYLSPKTMLMIFKGPSFWMITTVFILAVGTADGIYAMLPLFLVDEIGFERQWANVILGCAHVSGVVLVFFAGLITDRIGARRAMVSFAAITGVLTVLLGIFRGSLITPALVFLQATSIVCLFPPILVVASMTFVPHLRNASVSLLFAVAVIFGVGVTPLVIGYIAELFSISMGISFIGLLLLGSISLMVRLGPDA